MNTAAAKSNRPLQDVNIIGTKPLISPEELKQEFPVSAGLKEHIGQSRAIIEDILRGSDRRVIAIVGPCSIHDTEMALEYARKLKSVADEVSDRIFVVMRVYFVELLIQIQRTQHFFQRALLRHLPVGSEFVHQPRQYLRQAGRSVIMRHARLLRKLRQYAANAAATAATAATQGLRDLIGRHRLVLSGAYP